MKTSFLPATAAAVALLALAACQSAPPAPASVEHVSKLMATVESVDMASRQVLLRTADGQRATVVAGPEVRNLPQVRAGDHVTITYKEAVAVRMAPPGSPPPDAAGVAAERAALGDMPGGAAGSFVIGRVTVVSVAPDGSSVVYTTEDGAKHTANVREPKMQGFAKQLKAGEKVDVGFVNEVAISVEPM